MDCHPNLTLGKQILDALGIDPVYVVSMSDPLRHLSEAERRFVQLDDDKTGIAFTSPVADLMFKNNYLRYDWLGRGFCVVFVRSPILMTPKECAGIFIHEAGHYVAYCNRPERDEPDIGRAIKAAWNSMTTEQDGHDRRWLRATVHLWHRATKVLGYEIPFTNVLNLEQYGFGRNDLATALDEALRRESEPIESILDAHVKPMSVAAKPKQVAANQRESIAQRMKRLGLPRQMSAWIDGRLAEIKYGVCTVDGREVSDGEMHGLYERWRSGVTPRGAA